MLKKTAILGVLFTMLSSACYQAAAQDTAPAAVTPAPAAASSAANDATVAPDTAILKRTPVIDGNIEAGEWDSYYSFNSNGLDVNTYANWDSRNIYIGVRSNQPVDMVCVLDAGNDGWFHGDGNYEFKAIRTNDGGMNLLASCYESRNTKTPIATSLPEAETALITFKNSASDGNHMMEMQIPLMLIRGFKFGPNKQVGFQIGVKAAADDTAWIPANIPGDVEECTLVTKKFASLKPLTLGFDLKNETIARGDDLAGKFHITNSGKETVDVYSFVIAGEGKSGVYLSSEKVRLEGLTPGKHISHNVTTIIPTDMPVGCWALGAEISSKDSRIGAALASFEVVDPFDVSLQLPRDDVKADVKNVSVSVQVKNNMRRSIKGRANITMPTGWEIAKNSNTRDFTVASGGFTVVTFKAQPPLGELGNVPVKVEITVGNETKTLENSITVVNP